ncbi:helix-turn-helix domain-containing protein, partial [Candidatus Micrarchaeota archaeon]|nr:helix-turn-helix domain-containing protein [Candidatus Micrarchaeota archaeon]
MKKAEDVKIEEFIATPHHIPFKGALQRLPKTDKGKTNASHVKLPKYLTANFARFIGYLIGDGYVRKTSSYEISLSNTDKTLLRDFKSIVESLNLPLQLRIDKRNGVSTLFCFSVELGKILETMGGIAKRSKEKKIPTELLKSPNNITKEFIKAYFDCEASVTKRGDIVVTSASKELLEQVQTLLLRFGIISQLHKTTGVATNTKQKLRSTYYRLMLSGENTKIFLEEIGFSSSKMQKLRKSIKSKKFNTNIDIIPNLKNILKETREQLGLSQFKCGVARSTYQHLEKGDRNPSRSTFKKIVSTFQKVDSSKQNKNILLLSALSDSHIFWDTVVKKRKIAPKEEWVYDLQVEPTHNFIANGMIVHNTRFLQYVANVAPKSIYVSGKSVSGVGLTASAERDEESDGGWVLKAGALVLASGGNACIDEFDKIDDKERAALHEAMESQSVSVAKAGIVAKFKAKTSILAAANPKY